MSNPVLKLGSKVLGTLYGRKLIKSGKQVILMRSMDGFGMPKDIIDQLVSGGGRLSHRQLSGKLRKATTVLYDIDLIEIHYLHTVYQAKPITFQEKGVLYERPPYEAQYILPRKYFVAVDSQQTTLL